MKAAERHKLERNVLADWIGRTIDQLKPYSRLITAVAVVVLVAVAAAIVWPKIRDRGSALAWQTFYSATAGDRVNYVDLETIAEEHPGTRVAHSALVVAGDARLANGCQLLFGDKASAAQELRRAIADYATVIDESRDPDLRGRALFGRARAYEAVSGTRQGEGDLPKAIADYQHLVEKWPNSPYAPMAQEQLTRLKSQDIKAFYDKFAAYSPKLPVSKEPEGVGKQLPFDASSLPDQSSSEFSKLLNLGDLKVKGASGAAKGKPEKSEPPKTRSAKTEPSKMEPPKMAPPKTAPAKPETPKK